MRGVGVLTVLRIALKACKSKDGPLPNQAEPTQLYRNKDYQVKVS